MCTINELSTKARTDPLMPHKKGLNAKIFKARGCERGYLMLLNEECAGVGGVRKSWSCPTLAKAKHHLDSALGHIQ
jgi:hypothetical protein